MNQTLNKRYLILWRALFVFISLLLELLSVSSQAAEKPDQLPKKVMRIAYSSISGNMAPLWVTYEGGFFRRYGLDVELVLVEGGSRAAQTLISEDVAFAQMAGAGVIQNNLKGADVVMIAGVLNTMNYEFIVDRNIQRPDQLTGKAVAVSRIGSSSDFATRFALDRYGLVPGKDVSILEIGTQPDRFAALEAGRIQGVMLEVPLTLKAKKMGFRVLANLKMLGLEYQHTGIATTRKLIQSQPDLVRNFIKAYVEGIHYYKTHRKESLAVLAKYLKTNDAQALKEIYEDIGLALVPEKPYPTLKGIDVILQELGANEPKARTARPERFVDPTFIKELDSSGFMDRLYKATPVVATREDASSLHARVMIKEKMPPAKNSAKPDLVTLAKKSALTVLGTSGLPQEYTVNAGDTLSHLALRFYGSAHKWAKIYEANAEMLKNPHYIYIGQQLLIPADQPEPEKNLNQGIG
jgi:NitT/TauT family transport system substrate-binding protein